jgi:site-specific DNA recombinase
LKVWYGKKLKVFWRILNFYLMKYENRLKQNSSKFQRGTLDQEIKALNRKIKGYDGQERRLMSVLRLDVVKSDIVLDELNQMKKEQEADNKRLSSLTQTKNYIEKMIDLEVHLKQLCADIAPDLDNCTYQDKRNAYTYLDLKIVATPEGADIKGYLDSSSIKTDSCLPTIGQTWASLFYCRYSYSDAKGYTLSRR